MNFNMKTALVLGAALIGTSFSTATPVNATHQIGHAIVGGIIGGVIGGAIINNQRRRPVYVQPAPVYVQPAPVYQGLPPAHYDWCFRKFRSYDQRSNTYQPYNGPRRFCNSPWG
jgi:hypothetical protein